MRIATMKEITVSVGGAFLVGGLFGYAWERFGMRKVTASDKVCRFLSGGRTLPFLSIYGTGAVGILLANQALLKWMPRAGCLVRALIITAGITAMELVVGLMIDAAGAHRSWDYRKGPGFVSRFTAARGSICLEASAMWFALSLIMCKLFSSGSRDIGNDAK